MFVTTRRPGMQEYKGQDSVDRRNYWHSEPEPRPQRERRSAPETPIAPPAEEIDFECERWDGLS